MMRECQSHLEGRKVDRRRAKIPSLDPMRSRDETRRKKTLSRHSTPSPIRLLRVPVRWLAPIGLEAQRRSTGHRPVCQCCGFAGEIPRPPDQPKHGHLRRLLARPWAFEPRVLAPSMGSQHPSCGLPQVEQLAYQPWSVATDCAGGRVEGKEVSCTSSVAVQTLQPCWNYPAWAPMSGGVQQGRAILERIPSRPTQCNARCRSQSLRRCSTSMLERQRPVGSTLHCDGLGDL
mmetsp:Transcript_19869/g.57079  ORF Transcript_19869/g.57079 Transcript_19869/m.57079 type:complete len:232 (+) Transcript_19869:2198-2893(+)